MSVIHGELSKVDAVLATPDLEMVKVLDCGFLRGQHQNDVLLVILSNHHLHFGVSSKDKDKNQSSFRNDQKTKYIYIPGIIGNGNAIRPEMYVRCLSVETEALNVNGFLVQQEDVTFDIVGNFGEFP